MSLLLQIQEQLDAASQRVRALERALVQHPSLPSITANLATAVRLEAHLREQFIEAAAMVGLDVCAYRAFDEHERPNAGAAFAAIADFQRLLSVVFAAVKYGQKQRATVSEHVARETAFDFGFAFRGSVGVMLTIRNEQQLFESSLDDAVETVFSMAKAASTSDVLTHAHRIGSGPVNALYEWAENNANNGLGADIEWRRGEQTKRRLFVQPRELARLRDVIDRTSAVSEEAVSVVGTLMMADVDRNRFKIKRRGQTMIKGTLDADAVDERHRVSLPATYTAKLLKTTKTKYSTGKEVVRWHLVSLEAPSESTAQDLRQSN